MIHVNLQPEPHDFDGRVREPGNRFLSSCPQPKNKDWSKHNYWTRVSNELYTAYGGICAYTGQWFPKSITNVSIDHFLPKSHYPEKAYEWDNYRLTTPIINNYKKDKFLVDPCAVEDGDFIIDFPSCLVKPKPTLSPSYKNRINQTIATLHLNDEDNVNQRFDIIIELINGDISKKHVESKYPFIAKELERQNLYDKLKSFFKPFSKS